MLGDSLLWTNSQQKRLHRWNPFTATVARAFGVDVEALIGGQPTARRLPIRKPSMPGYLPLREFPVFMMRA